MANTTLTADIVAKEALMILENNIVMGSLVHRGYEDEFDQRVNGYKIGETLSIRRPTDFTVREGAVASVQDVVEGKITLTVDKQRGVDFKFTSEQLTLQIGELSERVIKPAMVQLGNRIDRDIMALAKDVWNHVTLPSPGTINSFADYALALERMDVMAVPQGDRSAVLSPANHWALLGSQTALFIQDAAKGAYREGSLGKIGGVDTYMSQNTPTFTVGNRTGTDVVDQALIDGTITYDAVKNTGTMTLHIDGTDATTSTIKQGETFTISNVYAVNPVTKERQPHLQQFVVMADATMAGSEGDLTISPPIIFSGAQQTISTDDTDLNDNTITWSGTASTGFAQNLFFHKNAFSLVMVPMVKPPGAPEVSRKSYKGYSVRVIPVYDGINDHSMWRLDVLYGTKTIDPRLAVRASAAADVA